MKILKLLNKKYFSIIFTLIIGFNSFAEDKPIDIWEVNEKQMKENEEINSSNTDNQNATNSTSEFSIYQMQSQNKNNVIELDQKINSQTVRIIGLYDPEDFGLDINMWSNSDGDQLKNIFEKLNRMKLSEDANEILKITLFTNSYYPKKNIKEK